MKNNRQKLFLTKQNQWTLVLLFGFGIIYLIIYLHLQAVKPVIEATSSILIPNNQQYVEVPSLNIRAPLLHAQSTQEKQIQIALAHGVVQLLGTAEPGTIGNMYIVGHSSNYKNASGEYNEIFAHLPEIQKGDEIIIDGESIDYTYVVQETRVVQPTELWATSQTTEGQKILTLQTSYPVGMAKQRFIAIAKLKE